MKVTLAEIIAPYLQNIQDQAGNHLVVVEAEDLKEIAEKLLEYNNLIPNVSPRKDWKIIFYSRKTKWLSVRDEYKLVDGDGEIRYIGTHSMCLDKLERGVC